MEQVSWNDCLKFIRRLKSHSKGVKFSLPTEAQWEYAARGGNRSRGYTYSGSNTVGDVAWYDGNGGRKSHDVGAKMANELGLYDMSGNVWEWCRDWYDRNAYSSHAGRNPAGPDRGFKRVVRGGRWVDSARLCRSASRSRYAPSGTFGNLGFRLVRSAQ